MPTLSRKDEAEAQLRLVSKFFHEEPSRFTVQGLVAHGNYGSTIRVRHHDKEKQSIKDFLVKMSFKREMAREALIREKEVLERLRGNSHIVQLVDIPKIPLASDQEKDGRKLNPDEWMVLEWIENGTLESFIMRMKRERVPRLPNMLLWRLFLCLIRGCNAMAWPKNGERPGAQAEASNLVHSDIHLGNILLGEPPMGDAEHKDSPILKLIDFGSSGDWRLGPNAASPMQTNVYDIGQIMMILVDLFMAKVVPPVPEPAEFEFNGNEMETDCCRLVPCPRDVDTWLVELICACMATNFNDRPTLQYLTNAVSAAVRDRTEEFYNDGLYETEETIERFWREFTIEAPNI